MKTWTTNLMQFQYGKTSRRHTTVECFSQMSKIPKEQHILDRYKTLASRVNSKKKRTQILAGEVRQLWKNLTLPIQQGKSTAERKIENVIKQFERNSRRPGNYDFTKLFNVTDEKGEWLCQENREFYKLQMSMKGKVGYCSRKEGNKAIHPRKMKSFNPIYAESYRSFSFAYEEIFDHDTEEISESEESVQEEQLPSSDEDFWKPSTSEKQKTASAIRLVTTAKLSTRKDHKVYKTLSESGVSIPTPSQSGVYRTVMRKGEELKEAFRRKFKT